MVEAVIFDWGGTLTPIFQAELEDMWRLAARRLAHDREDDVVAALVGIEMAMWQRTNGSQKSFSLKDILADAARVLSLDVEAAVLDDAAAVHLDSWTPHVQHEPDAVEVLEELHSRGLRIGLLSNTHWPRDFHEHFLERDGLAGLIDARFYTCEMEYMKPHRSVFETVLSALHIDDPHNAVFVGDRLFDDILGATRVGLRGVHRPHPAAGRYAPAPADVAPDAVIRTLSDLPRIIESWSA